LIKDKSFSIFTIFQGYLICRDNGKSVGIRQYALK
jgi:hypothetical protein